MIKKKMFWILSLAGSLVEMHLPDDTLRLNKPNWLQGWNYGQTAYLFGPLTLGNKRLELMYEVTIRESLTYGIFPENDNKLRNVNDG